MQSYVLTNVSANSPTVGVSGHGLACDSTWNGSAWTGGTTYVLPGDTVYGATMTMVVGGNSYSVNVCNVPTDATRGPAYLQWYANLYAAGVQADPQL